MNADKLLASPTLEGEMPLEFQLRHWAVVLLIENLGRTLMEEGGENFWSISFGSPLSQELPEFSLTMTRNDGKSPAVLLAEAKATIAELTQQLQTATTTAQSENSKLCPCGDEVCDWRHVHVEYSPQANFTPDESELLSNVRKDAFEGQAESLYIPYLQVIYSLSEAEPFEEVQEIVRIANSRYGVNLDQIVSIDLKHFYSHSGEQLEESR